MLRKVFFEWQSKVLYKKIGAGNYRCHPARRFSGVAFLGNAVKVGARSVAGVSAKGNRDRSVWARPRASLYTELGRTYCVSSPQKPLIQQSPTEFLEYLKKHGIKRCFIVFDKTTGRPKVSHPELEAFADFLAKDDIDYMQHEGAFMCVGPRTGALLGAFIWRTNRGQAVRILFILEA